jgi:hypothetical protein
MADTYKVLAQKFPTASVLTDAYTVPASTSAVISSLMVANQSTAVSSFRISVAIAGAADTHAQYLYFDEPIPPNRSFAITLGITLATTDVVRVQSANGMLSFNIFGSEVT